jgi:NADPH:quinone reductase-like Zn-dependent oxidoreductase
MPLENGLREILQALATSVSTGKKVKFGISENKRESLETVTALVEAGTLRPVVDHVYPMSEIAEAHRRVEGRHKRGSVVVTMGA